MSPVLRFVVLACIAASCSTTMCREGFAQGEPPRRERINIFDGAPKEWQTPRRTGSTDRARQMFDGVHQAASPEKRMSFWDYVYYGTFFVVLAVIITGLLYWEALRRKRMAWELNDPMALIKELNFVHHISDQEKLLMQEIADRNALPSPLALFVEPKYLLEARDNAAYMSSHSSVQGLLSKLFDITAA